MTTYVRRSVLCANCNKPSGQELVAGTTVSGSPDLYLRPPDMERGTIHTWVQRCPHCDYCSSDLSTRQGNLSKVTQPDFRAILADTRFPKLTRKFLASALLLSEDYPDEAAQANLYAAWICDDAKKQDEAKHCRNRAAACFARLKPLPDTEEGVNRALVSIDVLRRVGRFEDAASECKAIENYSATVEILRDILEFQNRLIGSADTAVHLVSECGDPSE